MDGARIVFLAQGFDAASMGEIAREARVSKGTLYVYFDSKERLFQAIVEEECGSQAEQVFALDSEDHDVEAVLLSLGKSFLYFLCQPYRVSPLRTVISIADRMPELGKRFYETGPASGIARAARYLEDQMAAGILAVEDCELAAAQFLDSVSVDDIQAAPVQCCRAADGCAYRACRGHSGSHLSCRLSTLAGQQPSQAKRATGPSHCPYGRAALWDSDPQPQRPPAAPAPAPQGHWV